MRVCDLFCNDGEKRSNTNVFQGFSTKLQGKAVAQNRFLTVAHRPKASVFRFSLSDLHNAERGKHGGYEDQDDADGGNVTDHRGEDRFSLEGTGKLDLFDQGLGL